MAKTYSEKLTDVRWQQKRLRLLEAANWKCWECGASKDVSLQIHHCYYTPRTDPWDYEDDCYRVLCRGRHEGYEEIKALLSKSLFTKCYKDQGYLAEMIKLIDQRKFIGISAYPDCRPELRIHFSPRGKPEQDKLVDAITIVKPEILRAFSIYGWE